MVVKLDVKDIDIISELDCNARQPISQIAKKVGLSREVVAYRINQLETKGIILRYYTEVNVSKLGVQLFRICLLLNNLTKEKEEEIFQFFNSAEYMGYMTTCDGKWDVVIAIGFKSVDNFNNFVTQFYNKFALIIMDKEVLLIPGLQIVNRQWLAPKKGIVRCTYVGGFTQGTKIDGVDRAILEFLTKDCRISSTQIAQKINISATAVITRIKKLEKLKIINSYRFDMNILKLGKDYCQLFLYLTQNTSKNQNKLISYCRTHPCIVTAYQCIGKWDFEFIAEVNDFRHFHKIVRDVRSKFDFIKRHEFVITRRIWGPNYGVK